MNTRALSLLALACLPLCPSLRAADLAVVNPGFEDVSVVGMSYNEFTFGALPGWSFYDPSGAKDSGAGASFYIGTLRPVIIPAHDPVNHQHFPDGAPEGERVGIAFNYAPSGGSGEYGLSQTLAATLQADTHYTLTVRIGNIAGGYTTDGSFFPLAGFPGYRVDLLAGGVVVASDDNSLAGSIPEGAFGLSTTVYDSPSVGALIGQTLSIRLVNLNQVDASFPASDLEVDFDDVRLTATAVAVPEPAAFPALAGVAALAAGLLRRRAIKVS